MSNIKNNKHFFVIDDLINADFNINPIKHQKALDWFNSICKREDIIIVTMSTNHIKKDLLDYKRQL